MPRRPPRKSAVEAAKHLAEAGGSDSNGSPEIGSRAVRRRRALSPSDDEGDSDVVEVDAPDVPTVAPSGGRTPGRKKKLLLITKTNSKIWTSKRKFLCFRLEKKNQSFRISKFSIYILCRTWD